MQERLNSKHPCVKSLTKTLFSIKSNMFDWLIVWSFTSTRQYPNLPWNFNLDYFGSLKIPSGYRSKYYFGCTGLDTGSRVAIFLKPSSSLWLHQCFYVVNHASMLMAVILFTSTSIYLRIHKEHDYRHLNHQVTIKLFSHYDFI